MAYQQLFTVKEVADLFVQPSGKSYTTGRIRQLCIEHGIGELRGRDRFLSEEDLERLEQLDTFRGSRRLQEK